MKKILALLLIGLVAESFAVEIRVDWGVANGFYFGASDPGVGILGPDGSGKQTWMQLVSVGANGKRDFAGTSTNTFWFDAAATLTGDDVVLASYNIIEDGISGNDVDNYLTYAYTGSINYVAPFVAGSVYARIFQDSTPGVGDWYAFSEVLVLTDLSGTAFPQILDLAPGGWTSINTGAMDPTTNNSLAGNAQVVAIPEPATFGLMALGGIGAFILRRNKLKAKEEADA